LADIIDGNDGTVRHLKKHASIKKSFVTATGKRTG
jgi:hypothetical protein